MTEWITETTVSAWEPGPMAGDHLDAEVAGHLQALRETVEAARSMPMSASVLVNRADLLQRLADLEQAFKSAVHDAQELVGHREEVVAAGRDEADRMVHEAELEQERLVSDTEVLRVAIRETEEMKAEAAADIASLRADTEGYVSERLTAFEETLDGTLDVVRRGLERLREGEPVEPAYRHRGPEPGDEPFSDTPLLDAARGYRTDHMAALGDDSDVDSIVLPAHLQREA